MTDFKVYPQEEQQQDDDNCRKQKYVERFACAIMAHQDNDALIAELQRKHPCTPFSEESKILIKTEGKNIEGFELRQSSMPLLLEIRDGWNCP